MKNILLHTIFFSLVMALGIGAKSQMITGVWQGKINRQKAELKIIRQGDSLTGTSYYYESAGNYRRYSIKGYFNPLTNAAVWWDDQLIEEKSGRFSITSPGKIALLSEADFNCPGSDRMLLDGSATKKEDAGGPKGEVHLDKMNKPMFRDEWDFVIENYTAGANDPDIIDSVASIAQQGLIKKEPVKTISVQPTLVSEKPVAEKKLEQPAQKITPPVIALAPPKPLTIQEKFSSRKNILATEIPLTGDSIELHFYDNAEVDGDSISLFLNHQLIFEHIALTEKAYIIKIAVAPLLQSNELVMVAENLGSIPPNTAYMVVLIGDKRYDARLESDEGASAMVRFRKQ